MKPAWTDVQRSAHANAYFTGFGAAKRVVFYDTLLKQLSPAEVDAVLAHELGHAADPDVWLPGSEQRADDIAERATGHRIRYTRRLRVQTFGPGIYPRPSDLHA